MAFRPFNSSAFAPRILSAAVLQDWTAPDASRTTTPSAMAATAVSKRCWLSVSALSTFQRAVTSMIAIRACAPA